MAVTAEIEHLEEQLRAAMLASDCVMLGRLLGDDMVFTNQDGMRLTKEDDMAAHASGLLQIARLEFSSRDIRVLGDAAIVCVVAALEGRYAQQPFGGTFAYTRLWLRSAGDWQVEAAHCSPATSVS